MEKQKSLSTEKKDAALEQGERTRQRRCFSPRTDIYETDKEIILTADIPGADEKSVEINLEKNILTINAFTDTEGISDHRLAYQEYGIGDYRRSFTLNGEIDREKIEAVVKNGVLTLHLPKSEAARARKITVKAG